MKSFEANKAKAVPGVKEVLQVPSGVAVVATDFWAAKKGREALEIVWDEGEWARLNTSEMAKEYLLMAATPGTIARKDGDPELAYSQSGRKLTADYSVPFLAHATPSPRPLTGTPRLALPGSSPIRSGSTPPSSAADSAGGPTRPTTSWSRQQRWRRC